MKIEANTTYYTYVQLFGFFKTLLWIGQAVPFNSYSPGLACQHSNFFSDDRSQKIRKKIKEKILTVTNPRRHASSVSRFAKK